MPPQDYFGRSIPFLDLLGVVPRSIAPGAAEVVLPFRPELTNSTGVLHGGMLMSTLDFAMSAAARGDDPDGWIVATIDMTTSFVAGGRGELTIRARTLRAGRSIVFCEAEARDEAGELVAKASGSFSRRRRAETS